MTHTPGPWRLEGIAGAKYPDLTQWAVLAPNPNAGKKGVCYSGDEYTIVFSIEDEDDARLIASAPDLLAALEELETLGTHGSAPSFTDWTAFHDKVAQIARAAILKARGPQATSSYLNKPLRSFEQAVRDSEGRREKSPL